ncbi:MAG TPA: 50S ribosomal protein L15 [Syntrophales bacterium]|nr:50S ribosomal protein L15 [Syntrophales bacterium]
MNLGTLKAPAGASHSRKRLGRGDGSGHGGTAGRGDKGQRARSGGKVRRGFEGGQMPLARRLPKRGFKNPFRREFATVNLDQLKGFPQGAVVDADALIREGIVFGGAERIKILGRGELPHPLSIKMEYISRSARKKIEAAGGTVIEVA